MAEVKLKSPVPAQHYVDLPPEGESSPGSFTLYVNNRSGGAPAGMIYTCPCGCGQQGSLAFRQFADARDIEKCRTWEFNGSIEKPTLTPSINHVGHWHGYLHVR